MSCNIFLCSEVFNDWKASFLFCLLLFRCRGSASRSGLSFSRAVARRKRWEFEDGGGGAGAAGEAERDCTGIGELEGGGGEKDELFAFRPLCFLILLAWRMASLTSGSLNSSACSSSD